MATNITAGNATNGAAISSDNTGTLAIKTGTGAGTTAISIDASQNVAITGTLTVGGILSGGNYALVAYTSPATGPAAWDANTKKAAGLKAIKVTVVGAGGDGGSQPATNGAAGGGGGGGAAIEYIPAPSIPGPVDITAGPGTNSFGAFCSATAGSTGAASSPTNAAGGAGGAGSGGTFNMTGDAGGWATYAPAASSSGNGGCSIMGGGGVSRVSPTSQNGAAGGNYGGGGSGGIRTGAGPFTGGAGAPGIVIVEEFY
jgi:hypothetical protein